MTTETVNGQNNRSATLTAQDLRDVGFTPREIHRLTALRACVDCYPHIEFFGSNEWKQLLFLKWRIDHGQYAR